MLTGQLHDLVQRALHTVEYLPQQAGTELDSQRVPQPGHRFSRMQRFGGFVNLDQGVVVQQRIVDLTEAATQAGKAFRIARVRYEEGEEDLLSVLTIQQRVISARSSQSSAKRLLLEQRVNLNLALGGSWEN